MIVGAFDLATRTGYAIGTAGGAPAHGVHQLPRTGRDYGHFGDAFATWLREMIREHGIELVVYETPVLPATTNIETLRKLYSLGTVTEMVVRRWNAAANCPIEIWETDMQTVRSHFIKATRAPKGVPPKERRAWMKRRITEECRARGWSPQNDDEADALSILDYALTITSKTYAANNAGPLLTGARI